MRAGISIGAHTLIPSYAVALFRGSAKGRSTTSYRLPKQHRRDRGIRLHPHLLGACLFVWITNDNRTLTSGTLRWGLSVPTWLLGSRAFREPEALEALEKSACYVQKTS